MQYQGIKKNFILSTLYQIMILITPLITAPYISRVLGADGIGIYSYTYSIQMYFSMFAALGTVSYGGREIARNRSDENKRSKIFWEVEILTIVTTLLCLIVWGIWISFNSTYRIYFLILTINLLATLLDISWFYTGLEQFKYIITQNTIFKLLGIVAIFLFVKTKDDVAIYIAILSLTVFLGNFSMWIYLPKFLVKVPLKNIRIVHHFKETLIYFVPTIATSIYTVLDKTLIGSITHSNSENGYYEQATKIINMAKAVTFTALNSVLSSRISFLFTEEKYDEIRQRIKQSMDYILFMGIGICFGLIGVADSFVPWFFGDGYDKVVVLLKLLSPIVVIIGISNCLGMQYYTPAGLRSLSAKFIITGSIINLFLNLILIPRYWSYGAVVSSVIAECVIMVLYIIFSNGYLRVESLLKMAWKKIIAGVVMLVIVRVIGNKMANDLIGIITQVGIGLMCYVLVLYILNDSFIHSVTDMFLRRKAEKFIN